jgi:hypothetical protein
MNEQSKISAPTTPISQGSYIKLEMWVRETKFDDVYEALNDIGGFGDKYILRVRTEWWESTSTSFRKNHLVKTVTS